MTIRTRFAPSPTGELHIGGARTALYNFLFAQHNKGEFLLRIEDTDRARAVAGSDKRIIKSLKWLRLVFDGEVYYQSQNLEKYKKAAEELINDNNAYYCFCSSERLAELRDTQKAAGKQPHYDEKCRELKIEESQEKIKKGEKYVIRLKVPETGEIIVDDLIRGKVHFNLTEIDDQILLKSDGYPTYHLASVIDDYDAEISHVLRAEEWLPSTPKHLLLYKFFGWAPPSFAHLPMLLGKDHVKLSKRHGTTSILEYKKMGYLPDALINFMALLGWNLGTDKEIFNIQQLINKFDLARVHKGAAVFDMEKLDFLNGYYIRRKSDEELVKLISRGGKSRGGEEEKYLLKIIKLVKERMKKLSDFGKLTDYFFQKPVYEKNILVFKKSDKDKTMMGLLAVSKTLEKIDDTKWVNIDGLNKELTNVVKENNLSNGDVFWPVRAALSGKEASPSPAELLWALGKKESLERIKAAIDNLQQ